MNVWQFIGSYWWLVFPLGGMVATAVTRIARAGEGSAKRRHERRLEIIRARGQLTAGGVAAAPEPTESTQAQLERLFAAHDEVTRRWLEYELDVSKLIAFPAMSDGRQPLTAAFLRAKKVADAARPASTTTRLGPPQLAEYRGAVTDYEVAFDLAERDARRLKDSSFSDAERKRLDTAQQLLAVAIDQAATPAERQLAYRRVREELDGLISVSDEAIDVLETKVALELTSAQTDAADPGGSRPGPATSSSHGAPPHNTTESSRRSGPTTAQGRVIRPKPPH